MNLLLTVLLVLITPIVLAGIIIGLRDALKQRYDAS